MNNNLKININKRNNYFYTTNSSPTMINENNDNNNTKINDNVNNNNNKIYDKMYTYVNNNNQNSPRGQMSWG